MRVELDSLVAGLAGKTGRRVEGRVFHVARSGVAAIIGDDGKQWMIYKPEIVGPPRSISARQEIPARFR